MAGPEDETKFIARRPPGTVLGEKTPLTIGLVLTLLGFAFWMGVQHSQMNELNTSVKEVMKDHETRIRVLEKRP